MEKYTFEECLNSLEMIESDDYEIVFYADNASNDGSVEFVKNHFPKVRIISLKKILDLLKVVIWELKKARGDYIVFLNNDTKVDVYWLKSLLEALEKYGPKHIYSSKVLFLQ